MQYKKELVPGIVLTVIAVLYLFFTTQIQPFTGLGATPLTNRFMPFFWGTCLLILSIMLIIRGVRMRKKELAAGKVATSGGFAVFWDDYKEVVLSFILLAIYIAFLESVGFIIMTALYVFAEILVLTEKSKRNFLVSAIVAVVVAFVLYFIFVKSLNVLLPGGILKL